VSLSINVTDEVDVLKNGGHKLVQSASGAFQDESLVKSKRIRSVLNFIECLTRFSSYHGDVQLMNGISKLTTHISKLQRSSESSAIKDVCANVIDLINKTPGSFSEKKKKGKNN
jgi:hypothetical protein